MLEEMEKHKDKYRNEWDQSTVTSEMQKKMTMEERVAHKIAKEVLKDN